MGKKVSDFVLCFRAVRIPRAAGSASPNAVAFTSLHRSKSFHAYMCVLACTTQFHRVCVHMFLCISVCVCVCLCVCELPLCQQLKLYSIRRSKLCVGVKYYIVHMYSMPYYTYGSTVNFLFLECTALIYIYQKNGAVTRIYVVLENLKLNE